MYLKVGGGQCIALPAGHTYLSPATHLKSLIRLWRLHCGVMMRQSPSNTSSWRCPTPTRSWLLTDWVLSASWWSCKWLVLSTAYIIPIPFKKFCFPWQVEGQRIQIGLGGSLGLFDIIFFHQCFLSICPWCRTEKVLSIRYWWALC